jgi:hypothetical protein
MVDTSVWAHVDTVRSVYSGRVETVGSRNGTDFRDFRDCTDCTVLRECTDWLSSSRSM